MSSSFKCVQLNCDFSSAGSSLLEKFAVSCKMDIIFVQDMYSSIKGLGENFTPIEFWVITCFTLPNQTRYQRPLFIFLSQ